MSRCASASSSAKSSWYQPWQASSWPPARIASIESGNVSSVWPGTNQVDGMPLAREQLEDPRDPTRGPNSPCENFTGGSPRRTLSEIAS